MSEKELAIKMLRKRFSESFALTFNSEKGQVYLFLIRAGMWALVTTFTVKDYSGNVSKFGVSEALEVVEEALGGKNQRMLERIDKCVIEARNRISSKISEFKR